MEGTVFTELGKDYKTQRDMIQTYMAIKNPFDEFDNEIYITVRNNFRRGKYEYLARRALANNEEKSFAINGAVRLYPFNDKKRRESGEYASIEIEDRFTGDILYCYIRDEVVRGAFTMLAKERLLLSDPKTVKE